MTKKKAFPFYPKKIRSGNIRYYLPVFFSLLFLHCFQNLNAQLLDSIQLNETNVYTDLSEALKQPDQVIKLELRKQKLKQFPLEILQFKNLQYLDLSKNQLKELPDSISQLKHLQYLDVSRNKLERLNKNIGTLSHLKYLNLNNNELYSLPPQIGNLSNLEVLDLWSNNLEDFPESLAQLKNLKLMDLRVILIPDALQEKIAAYVPWAKIHFSPSCRCKW